MSIFLLFPLLLQSLHSLSSSQTVTPSFIPKTRTPPSPRIFPLLAYSYSHNSLIVFSGESSSGEQNDLWTFNLTSLTWTMQQTLSEQIPDARTGSGGFASRFYSKFYVFGGLTSRGLVNDFWEYDLNSYQWTLLPTVNTPDARQMFAHSTYDDGVNEYFVVFGGKKNYSPGNSLHILAWVDSKDDKDAPPASYAGNLVVYNNQVYFSGGKTSFDTAAVPMLYKYNLNKNSWKNITSAVMYTPRSYAQSALIGSHFYLLYGLNEATGEVLKDVYTVDLSSNTYQWVQTNITEQDNCVYFDLVSINNTIYYFGGSANQPDSYSNTLKSLNTNTSQITSLSIQYLSPQARSLHSMFLISNQFYLFGGTDGKNYFNDMWSFDVDTELWTQISALGVIPSGRYGFASASQGDAFVIWGGENSVGLTNDMYQFNTLTLTWNQILPVGIIPNPAKGACMVLSVPTVYIYGGVTNTGLSNELWEYNIWTNSFEMISSDLSVSYCSCAYYNSEFYVIFGSVANSQPQPMIRKYSFDLAYWETAFETSSPSFTSIQGIQIFQSGSVLKIGGQSWDTYLHSSIYLINYNEEPVQFLKNIQEYTYRSAYVYYNYSVYVFGGGATLGQNVLLADSHNLMFKISLDEVANGTDYQFMCSQGTFSLNGTCALCQAGTFSPDISNSSCNDCPAGTYNSRDGASSSRQCYPCDEGKFNDLTGQAFCFDCPAGYICPPGSMTPIDLVNQDLVFSVQPEIYIPVSPAGIIFQFEVTVAIVCGIGLIFVSSWSRTRERLQQVDLYNSLHNFILNNRMVTKETRFGGFASISFFIIAIILIGSSIITFTNNNIEELKTLIPKVVLDGSVQNFISDRIYVQIELLRYGDSCHSSLMNVSLTNFDYTSINWTSELTNTRSCIIQFECFECILSVGSVLSLVSNEKLCYTSGINVNVTSSSSIPNQNSSILQKLVPDYNHVFIGSDPSVFEFTAIPSFFESESNLWPSNATGYHIATQIVPVAGSQFMSVDIVTASLLKVNVLLEVSLSGLYTSRYLKQTLVFMFSGLIGSVFGIMGAVGGVMKLAEKWMKKFGQYVKRVNHLHEVTRKRVEFDQLFDDQADFNNSTGRSLASNSLLSKDKFRTN